MHPGESTVDTSSVILRGAHNEPGAPMSETTQRDASTGVADNFTNTAKDYDAVVRHNVQGANRLVTSLPDEDYRRVLDVGCGTGWSALAMLERFPGITHLTGVDPAQGMLDVFGAKLGELKGVQIDLRAEDVMAMSVEAGGYDAVISSMAMHWFPDKAGAAVAMGRAVAPGGVLGILCSGTGGEHEFRQVLRDLDPPGPPEWDAAFDFVQRDVSDMETYLVDAGLEPIDIWMERRRRYSTPEAYLERMRVVASHITAGNMTEDEVAELLVRVQAGINAVSGPRGFEYTFTKLYAIARKPA
jgi:ubiquinone/menaquinone biosynthesis C-methylase UbiE